MNRLVWLVKQLLPLRYESIYGESNQQFLSIWRMWFGRCFSVRTHALANNDDIDLVGTLRLTIKDQNSKIKNWQQLVGKFAADANWAAIALCNGEPSSNDIDQANDVIDRVGDYLAFDEQPNS